MDKYQVPGTCIVCGEKMEVKRIQCPKCDTAVEGSFGLCKFCYLTKEQKKFIEIFMKCRGNIKEVGKELNISYPTVKSKLDDVVLSLGYIDEPMEESDSKEKNDVLMRLNQGEISVQEALELLNDYDEEE